MRIIQPIVSQWEKFMSQSSLLTQFYAQRYREVVEKEVALANITPEDLVLNIGCGALPFTAIHAARLTGARVIALDRDETAVLKAQSCLAGMGLGEKVQVVLSDAAAEIPKDFTVAIVALQAEPKLAIAERLLQAARPGARLVFRRPHKSYARHYDCLPEALVATNSVKQDKRTFDASILLTK